MKEHGNKRTGWILRLGDGNSLGLLRGREWTLEDPFRV